MNDEQRAKLADQVIRMFNNLARVGVPEQQIKREVYVMAETMVRTQLTDMRTHQQPDPAEVHCLTDEIY